MKKLLLSIAAAALTTAALAQAPAFPGAEGHGRYVTGGRGGVIRHVTNLNNSGEGSFRAAVMGDVKKIVVFDVAGVIELESDVSIGANTTIMGQTAPYPGITLRYYTVHGIGDNVIIRFLRSRRGQERDVNDGADAIWERQKTGIIIDHCSFSWSIDEVASFYDNNNFTLQWSTLGESLNNAGHSKSAHGYGGIWGGKLASFHHNLITHVNNRSPRFNGARYNWTGYNKNTRYSEFNWQNAVQAENVDFRNCVVYNCGNGCYGGPGGGQINMVNNYYKTGPAAKTNHITIASVANSTSSADNKTYWNMLSRYYISGNQLDSKANADWDYVTYDEGATYVIDGEHCTPDPNHYYGSNVTYKQNSAGTDCVSMKLTQPVDAGTVTTHTAANAFTKVLDYGGASLYRDEVDTRYASEAKNGTATYTGTVTGKPGRIDLVSDVHGYKLGSSKRLATFDADGDGMADEWEKLNGGISLAPNGYDLDPKGYYTNIEVYCNSLVEDIMKQGNSNAATAVDEYYPACQKLSAEAAAAGDYEEPEDNSIKGLSGQIRWTLLYDDSKAPVNGEIATSFADYISGGTVSWGANLIPSGNGTYGDVRFSKFQSSVATESEGNNDNAVNIQVKTTNGNTFQASGVTFNACKVGTDNGKIDVTWTDAGGKKTVIKGASPSRNKKDTDKGYNYFTAYNLDLSTLSTETDGTCTLSINCYALGNTSTDDNGNVTNTYKEMGIANLIINGVITNVETGLHQPITLSVPVSTDYYNTAGQRISPTTSGLVIQQQHYADGQVVSRKVVKH